MGDLLVVESLGFFFRDALGELPAPRKRQHMPLLLADNLGSRMGGRNIRAGHGREPINQAIETAVVVRLQDNGVVVEEDFSQNDGNFLGFQPEFRLDPGTIEQEEPFDLQRLGIVGIERAFGSFVNRLIATQRGLQTASVPDRPAQVNELDLIVGRTAFNPLAEGLELHSVERRARACDVAPQRGDRTLVIGDPQAAQAAIAIRDRSGPRTGGKSKVSGSLRGSITAIVDFWKVIS